MVSDLQAVLEEENAEEDTATYVKKKKKKKIVISAQWDICSTLCGGVHYLGWGDR